MSLLKLGSLILMGYLAAGRTGLVAACLLLGVHPLETLLTALLIDVVQIPIYGIIIEMTRKYVPFTNRIRSWVERRSERIQEWMNTRRSRAGILRYQPLAVVVVSTIPFRGFGIFSATLLAFLMGYRRVEGTLLIMAGSFVGSTASILIFYLPARWVSGL